jgi:hypothetical protein
VKRTAQNRLDAPSLDAVAAKEIATYSRPRRHKTLPADAARDIVGRPVAPTTSESDHSAAEEEFMAAMQQYKQDSGRMFPTWSEVLEVLQSLGYRKPA